MGRRFYFHRRGKFLYAEIVNPETGRRLSARSTGCTDRDEAVIVVNRWLTEGIPDKTKKPKSAPHVFNVEALLQTLKTEDLTPEDGRRIVKVLHARRLVPELPPTHKQASTTLLKFLDRFWNYDRSPYVEEKRAFNQRIGRRHCYEMSRNITKYWEPYFGTDVKLAAVKRSDIRNFSLWLGKQSLQTKSRNNVLSAGTTALRWAFHHDVLPSDPTAGVKRFSVSTTARGILTLAEARDLFAVDWVDERARLASLLAMTTGLRQGEIQALRYQELVHLEHVARCGIEVRHSWSEHDKLKDTKTGKSRWVTLLPTLRQKLIALAEQNPHGVTDDAFVFWSTRYPDRPVDAHHLNDGLRDALIDLTLSQSPETEYENERDTARQEARKQWRTRKVVFHSWRHFFSSHMADRVDERTVMLATGHANKAVFQSYADHADAQHFERMSDAVESAFGGFV